MADPRINPTNPNPNNRQAMGANRQAGSRTTQNNPGQTARSVGHLSSYGVARSGMNQVKEGDIVRGEISDLRNNEITITLENNTVIKGQIADSSSLSIGQTAAFRMNTVSPTGLFMEVLPNSFSETELTMINKALEEAGLPATQRNQNAVKALMDNLLPINKQSIQHLMQQAYDYGTEDMETLCLMNRKHLEITQDSVTQFSNYRNGQHQLLDRASAFSSQLPELLETLSENGPSNAVAAFGGHLLSITLSGPNLSAQPGIADSPMNQMISNLSPADFEALKELLANTPLEENQLQMLQNGTMSGRDALVLLRDATAAGTLNLSSDCSQAEMLAKMNEITQALGLSSPSPVSSTQTASTLAAQTENAAAGEPPEEQLINGQKTAPATEGDGNGSSFSLAGKLLHNLSDAAKNSFQALNQNINQMLASSQEGSFSLTHTPSVIDTLLHSVVSNGREQDALFTYLSPEERASLSDHLNDIPVSETIKERILSGEATTREVFTAIRNVIPNSDSGMIQQLFQTDAFQKLFTQSLMENFTVTPAQLSKNGELDSFYRKMESQMDSFEKLINSTLSGDDSRQLSGQAHDMQSNIDFMKSLNEAFGYMQLPLKLQNQNAHGDLYVYTKKEKLKKNPDKISLLLHLEMDHLGTLDIRLEKDKQNIDANFMLDNQDSIRLLERNTHMLQDSLHENGYTCNIRIQPQDKTETPVQDFLNTKITTASTREMKRFSFDIRA